MSKKKYVFYFFVYILLNSIILIDNTFANVSLKNGNFYSIYTDIIYSGGFEPKIDRAYNSKSTFKGIFGHGWGNEYEEYLTVSADGSVVVHEYGGGAENRFTPKDFKTAELDQAVKLITEAAQSAGLSNTQQYRERLRNDATFRNGEWEKFRAQGKLKARILAKGAQLQSNRFSYQQITKTDSGYVRTFDTGKMEKFNEIGRLVRISDKSGNFLDFTYSKDGHLQKIVDNFNRKMFFTFNNEGLLARIDGDNSKKAQYKYNDRNELVYSEDVDHNVYTYKYDSEGRHNLIEIGYADKTQMKMSYYGVDKKLNIKSVTDRDGTVTEYRFDSDSNDRGHSTVSMTVRAPDKKIISDSKYEYFLKYKSSGEDWTARLISTVDGDRTDTIYNEEFGLPVVIKHGNEETSFEYDAKGHVIKKKTPNEWTQLAYDPVAGKISRVSKMKPNTNIPTQWSEFQYDQKANLVLAKNSEGKGVKLLYDNTGRIRTLIDQNKHQISFKYNENSKPVEIIESTLGSITVAYNNSGEIKKVESAAGRKIALQVTASFQNLLDIIRPAGVTLAF